MIWVGKIIHLIIRGPHPSRHARAPDARFLRGGVVKRRVGYNISPAQQVGLSPAYCPARWPVDFPDLDATSGPSRTITVPFIPLVSCSTQT